MKESRHAFLITAYKDFDWLKKALTFYLGGKVDCYIHVDRKTKIPKEFLQWGGILREFIFIPIIELTGEVTSISVQDSTC